MAGEAASIGDALRALAGAVSPVLVTPAAWQRLVAAADAIPLVSGGGIECRPDNPGQADLAVRFLSTGSVMRELLDLPLAAAGASGDVMAALARRWVAAGQVPAGPRILWLELDLPRDRAPRPSVFAGPGNPPHGKPAVAPDNDEWDAIVALLKPGQSAASLTRLRSVLPAGAWVGYAGIMRGGELRATISGLTPGEIPALLQQVEWPGDIDALAPVLSVARTHGPRITLGFDVTDGIGPALGIELGPFAPDCWEGLLDASAKVAPLPRGGRSALLAWPGETVADPSWPRRLRERADRIVRRLNHVKFSIGDGPGFRLKPYLYFGLIA